MRRVLYILILAGVFCAPAFAINLDSGFDRGKIPANQITPDCSQWSKNLSCAQGDQQAVDNILDQLSLPATGWTLTDGTHTVTGVTQVTVTGATVGGASPNATLIITGGGSGNVGIGTINLVPVYVGVGTLGPSASLYVVGNNVGIGSTVPGQILDVSGTIRTTNFNLIPPASTFPTTSVLDTFTRSNSGSLGGNWTNSNNVTWGNDTLGINGNAANDSSGADGGSAFWNVTSFSGKIEAYVTVSNAGTSDPVGLICASSTSSYQGYWVRSDGSGHIQLVKGSSGAAVSLHNFTQTVSSGDSIGFSLDTSGNFTIYYKSGSGAWTTVGTYNDTSYSCSYIGIQLTDTVMRLTNFAGGTSGSAGSVNGDVLTTDANGNGTWQAVSNYWSRTAPYTYLANATDNVGIGSSTPGQTLDVNGTIRAIGTNPLVLGSDNNSYIVASSSTNAALQFSTNSQTRATITNAGNIGIGSASPGKLLDVAGSLRTTSFTLPGNNAHSTYVLTATDSSGDTTWSAAGGDSSQWTGTSPGAVYYAPGGTAGNVGIGSTVPGTTLDVQGTIRTSVGLSIGSAALTSTYDIAGANFEIVHSTGRFLGPVGSNPAGYYAINNDGSGFFSGGGPGTIQFSSGGVFTVTGQGANVGIGSTVPGDSLDVQGTIRTTNFTYSGNNATTNYILTASDSSGDATWSASQGSGTVNTGTAGQVAYYPSSTTTVGPNSHMVFSGSNVGLGSTAPGATLDVQGSVRITPPVGTNLALITTGNIGIGSNAPGDTLDVVGTLRMTHFTYSGNSATTNYVLTATDSSGDANWQAATGGSSQWTGTSGGPIYYSPVSTNANVGIGSTVPGETLDVYGTFRVVGNMGIGAVPTNPMTVVASGQQMASWTSTNNTQPYILIGNQSDGASMLFGEVNGGDGFFQSHDSAHKIQIQTSGNGLGALVSANVGINTTTVQTALSVAYGNVGIDTWSPGAELQVNSTIGMFVVTGAGNVGIGTQAPLGSLTVTNGNVGIGTFSPIDILDINGTGGAAVVVSSGGNVGIGTIATQVPLTVMSGNVGIGTISPIAGVQVSTTGNAYFGGNVGIGSLNPFNSLVVQNGIRAVGIGTTAVQILCVNNLHQVGVMSSGATGTCTVNTN